jgi:hypothetical protein
LFQEQKSHFETKYVSKFVEKPFYLLENKFSFRKNFQLFQEWANTEVTVQKALICDEDTGPGIGHLWREKKVPGKQNFEWEKGCNG